LSTEKIAVIGMAARFPGAPDVDTFWGNLTAGVESIRFHADDELLAAGVDPVLLADPRYVKAGSPLDGVDLFDAAFFGISPGVAQIIDPQQRVFLEVAWHALEHAGHDSARFAGEAAVFAGLSLNTYLLENLVGHPGLLESHGWLQAALASRGDHLALLTAYKLDLRGPAFGVQSTCSTALSAVHLACQALLTCQADLALAGGVAVHVPQTAGYLYQEGDVYSPDGHCRPFDAQARGTVFGSGAGVVVLRRLEEALADGDTIYAVIRGSAANNDGAGKSGYTAPSPTGQRRAVGMAHALAGVSPRTIGYVECHGTGTPLGDPIEVRALTEAFGADPAGTRWCALGSVKSNVGHLDTAAGVAGLIKAILCLHHRQIPPTLHFNRPNPQLELERSPFHVNATLIDWPAPASHPRRAGVSAFGIGGTNVHVVLEEAPAAAPEKEAEDWHTLVLSARTASALEAQTARLQRRLAEHGGLRLPDVAHTLQAGRRLFAHRRAFACRTTGEAAALLDALPPDQVFTAEHRGGERPVAFLFPGLGGQRAGMARLLHQEVPLFRRHLEEALAALGDLPRSILLSPETPACDVASARLAEAAVFAFEVALGRTWIERGVRPRALLGDGIGEYAALCIGEAVSLEDAATMVLARGRLLDRLPAGAMAVVRLPADELAPLLARHGLALAMAGGPSFGVVSGDAEAVDGLGRTLAGRGAGFRRLPCDRALQSPAVEAVLEELAAALQPVAVALPAIPVVAGTSGQWLDGQQSVDWPRHLGEQLRRPLCLSRGIAALYDEPDRVLLEVGPGRLLLTLARLHSDKGPRQIVLGSLAGAGGGQALATTAGRLWLHGVAVDWSPDHRSGQPRRVPLPPYPFERRRLWIDPPRARATRDALPPRQADLARWFYLPSWRRAPPLPAAAVADPGGPVLLFEDQGGIGEALAARLAGCGRRVVRVAAGDRAGTGDCAALDPVDAGGYRELLRELERRGEVPSQVVHLWSVDPHPPGLSPLEALARAQRLGFGSLLCLAQAVGETMPGRPLGIDVVSSELHAVLGDEPLCPEKALLLGPLLVLGQEYPWVRGRGIDIVRPTPGRGQEARLVEQLLREIESPPTDRAVAHRGQHRWVRAYAPVPVTPSAEGTPVRAGGVYLVTGGLGGIGLRLARTLAELAPIKLVLVGRRTAGAEARRCIEEIEGLGSEVMVACADVADRPALTEVLAQTRRRWGPIHGVLHAAGVPGGGVIQRKTEGIAAGVLRAKTIGTLLLEELLGGDPLDFFACCGSRTALLGGYGQADYAAANAFLDAFAQDRRRRSGPRVTTIDWCGWKEVGMLAAAAARRQRAPVETAPPEPAQEIGHPLLQRRVSRSAERIVYESELGADTHWVLADHRIAGNPVLAGTTYLEMVRAALERSPEQTLELSDVLFVQPLMVPLGERRVARLELTAAAADGWAFEVSSRVAGATSGAQRHATGKARVLPASADQQVDLAALAARCNRRVKVLTDEDAMDEDHGPRWQCTRTVRWGDDEVLATLELPAEFAGDLDRMKLHPALLDKAIGTGRDFIVGAVPYLPYAYRRLVWRHPLAARIHVHTRAARSAGTSRAETPTFNLTIADDAGRELVRIEEFAVKRINDVRAVYRAVGRDAGADEEPRRADAEVLARMMAEEGITPDEGAEAFRRILLHGALGQVVVSTRDMELLEAAGGPSPAPGAEPPPVPGPARPLRPRPELPTTFVAPEGPLETQLAAILCEGLGLDQIGAQDSFFDLGGDSLLAIQIVARIQEATGRSLEVVQLFEAPTVVQLTAVLEGTAVAPGGGQGDGDGTDRGARRLARVAARRQGSSG
jgi:phthiocerol/phenolphthiocerol synthesis type-I polyketide synthase E